MIKLLYSDSVRRIDMSKRPRRNHAPAFKAKVALEALKGEQTVVEHRNSSATVCFLLIPAASCPA
ncbi:MAG: hypothetical protein M0Q23_08675 [Syntrophales bacterium]|nr:hypothetical protein [Syntrophales bacterium]MCK9528693.1 hypothetical protein [Syntrophales bacterium]MDX9922646.1 hypothetical protein [Syntrophales bacterium]